MTEAKRWLAFDIGCIECGEASAVIGIYATPQEAQAACDDAAEEQARNWHGQHSMEVFDLANQALPCVIEVACGDFPRQREPAFQLEVGTGLGVSVPVTAGLGVATGPGRVTVTCWPFTSNVCVAFPSRGAARETVSW